MRSRYESQDSLVIQKSSLQTAISRPTSPSKVIKQCRICLQNQQQTHNPKYINPCKCTGSVKYVHQSCLKTWIASSMRSKNKQEQHKIQKQGIPCQMCKYIIKFEMDIYLCCNTCEQMITQIKIKRILFIVIILLVIVSCGGLSFSLYSIVYNSWQFNLASGIKFQMILAFCGAALLLVFFILGLYTLINQYFVRTNVTVGKIKSQQLQKSRLNLVRVTPILDQSDLDLEVVNIN